ncbi:MAG: B12-binding domain-containing radical SAM protein [Anaerolineae bacterium]
MSGGLALVYPYFYNGAPEAELYAPLGIACLASQARAAGIETRQFDCTFSTFEAAAEVISLYQPAVVGMSLMTTMSRSGLRLLTALRPRLPGTLFAAGGPLPSVYPARYARVFDVVFRGESDLTFARFCRDYLALGAADSLYDLALDTYPGIYLPGRMDVVIEAAPSHQPEAVLDALPLPDRSAADHARYQAFWLAKTGHKPASLMLTRGCPYQCDFCSKPIYGSYFRRRSLDGVMAEVEEIARLGYDQLRIADDCLTLDPAYLGEFCARMAQSKLGLSWTCLSRVDGLTPDLVRLMRQAGCIKVYLGLESGSDATLRAMHKGASVAQGAAAVSLFVQAGIRVGAYFIVGYPGESQADIESTFRYALELPLDEISFNVPLPLPGSALYARVGQIDADDDWDAPNETRFVYLAGIDSAWLRGRIADTLAAFRQLRPSL